MPAAPIIGSGISAGAGLLGSGKAAHAQQQDANAASGLYNEEAQSIGALLNNYFQQAPQFESGVNNLVSEYGNVPGQIGALTNPIMSQLQNVPGQYQAAIAPVIQGLKDVPQQTQNLLDQFWQHGGSEIQSMTNQYGNQTQSMINSLRQNAGGIANPQAFLASLAEQGAQGKMQMGQQLQSQLGGQAINLEQGLEGLNLSALGEQGSLAGQGAGIDLSALSQQGSLAGLNLNAILGALSGAGSALGSLGNFITAPLASGLSGLNNIGNTYMGAASSYGNPWASGIGGVGSFLSNLPGSSYSGSSVNLPSGVGPGGWVGGGFNLFGNGAQATPESNQPAIGALSGVPTQQAA